MKDEYQNKDIFDLIIPKTTVGKALTALEAANYTDKTVVFGQVNGQVESGSTWDFNADLLTLQGYTN